MKSQSRLHPIPFPQVSMSSEDEQLIQLLEAAAEENRFDFVNDILVRYKNVKKIYGYKIK